MTSLAALFPSLLALTFVVVPLDDRPVTAQLPRLLGAIAGVRVVEPPRPLLGRYLTPGQPDAILRWLRAGTPADAAEYVVSSDMAVYGGLVASRIPGVSRGLGYTRLQDLADFRASRPSASFAVFGTVMRLAPTGVPALGPAAAFPFSGEQWPLIQKYANLPDPPVSEADRATAARLRERLGPVLDAYLETRARNRDVDLFALREAAEGAFDRVVLGQDDAGPVGLHLRDLAALRGFAARWVPPARASIEPGADELGMALVGAALARQAKLVPRVRVIYSRADGGSINDPIEFAPISTTIADLIRTCGGVMAASSAGAAPGAGSAADIDLFVNVPDTSDADEERFVAAIGADAAPAGTGRSAAGSLRRAPLAAVADLTFLKNEDYAQQRRLTNLLIDAGTAGRVGAFASWNTTANTVGTALPEAIAVLAGRKLGTYDARMHATFTLMRYVDDIAFHDDVRPKLNTGLTAAGIADHTYLAPDVARRTDSENRALLWPDGLDLLARIAPQFRDAGFTIRLPWDRTFETELDVRLAPAR
ncbi:MAG: hypothetical protein QOI11_2756 [Candidatus Eremiobacteraeota bacterium]|nr:hypothetical protein [Candidatus Eremiobacteraeota bacterium]